MLVLDKKELFEEVNDLESATVSGGGDANGLINLGVIGGNVANGGNVADLNTFFGSIFNNDFPQNS